MILTLNNVSPHSVVEIFKKTVGESEKTVGKSEKTVGESEKTVGESEKTVGESEKTVGKSEKTVGKSEKTVGKSEKTVGESEKTVGKSEKTVGKSEKTVGKSEKTVGESEKTVGKSEKTVGKSEKTVGKSAKSEERPEGEQKGCQRRLNTSLSRTPAKQKSTLYHEMKVESSPLAHSTPIKPRKPLAPKHLNGGDYDSSWVPSLGLDATHRETIQKGGWLNGDIVVAAQGLLRRREGTCTDTIGLQDPGCAENPTALFIPQGNGAIQIHHNGLNHWLTSTATNGVVKLYDSIWMTDIAPSIHLQLGAMCKDKRIVKIVVSMPLHMPLIGYMG